MSMTTLTNVKIRPHRTAAAAPPPPRPPPWRATKPTKSLMLVVILGLSGAFRSSLLFGVNAQRSLHHWKRDLEHRLDIYHRHRSTIDDIISSSIYPARDDVVLQGPIRVVTRSNVRFSDLIIPAGALRLSDPSTAQAAIRILADKTRHYVATKAHELREIQHQLESMRRQLDDPANRFIYKGQRLNPNGPPPQMVNAPDQIIMGTRVFKQAQYVRLISGRNVTMHRVNGTSVNQVIDDTYLRNSKFAVRDFDGRPYFEGRKTLYDSVFVNQLVSGCCGRLQPLDTARVMLRSKDQNVAAPVLIKADLAPGANQAAALIHQLNTEQFLNQIITLDPKLPPNSVRLARDNVGLLLASPVENIIRLSNLIHTRQIDRAQLLKTLIFKSPILVEQALLSQSYPDSRLIIGVASQPGFRFDLSHDNYLLKYAVDHHRNATAAPIQVAAQRVTGALVIDGMASFVAGLEAPNVNGIDNFGQFLNEALVRIDRPSNILGPIEFNALPALLNSAPSSARTPVATNPLVQARRPLETPRQNVLIVNVRGGLELGSINGMRVPQDLIILPSERAPADQNARHALKPGQPVHVHGPVHFANEVQFSERLEVANTISGLAMPGGVIPLHLNDFIDSVGVSNLWFMDGIEVQHLTTQSNQFDEINLSEVNGGAPSIMLNLMSVKQPDGSVLIKAPLRVANLNLLHTDPNTGLLNGFRPQEVLELNPRYPYETIHGQRTFQAPVEAGDCIFGHINGLANWSNQLIRIDRPNTVQTVYSKLAFAVPPVTVNNTMQQRGVNIDRLNVEFYPDSSPAHYRHNWNYSPEFYLLRQALMRSQPTSNSTGGRYRVNQVRLVDKSGGLVNGIPLGDVVTLDAPFRFADRFTMVGKVEVANALEAAIITSAYPIDAMDLAQFNKYRIPISGHTLAPVKLNNLVLGTDNRASYVNSHTLNQTPLSPFMRSVMSLTKPQEIRSNLVFTGPVNFEGLVKTRSSLNGIKNFDQFVERIMNANYVFDKGLQCQSVIVRASI